MPGGKPRPDPETVPQPRLEVGPGDPPRLTEEHFLQQIIDLAHYYGWFVAHFRPARTEKGWRTAVQADALGFPDLVLVREGELIFAELKTDKGTVSRAQRTWITMLRVVAGKVDSMERALRVRLEAHEPQVVVDAFEPARVDVYLWRPRDFDEIHARLKRRHAA